jgi:hypothetical protein
MSQINVSAEIPQQIAEGLKSGTYDRIGGAIREIATREIIAWLREAHDFSEPVVSELLSLSTAPVNANALNLALIQDFTALQVPKNRLERGSQALGLDRVEDLAHRRITRHPQSSGCDPSPMIWVRTGGTSVEIYALGDRDGREVRLAALHHR